MVTAVSIGYTKVLALGFTENIWLEKRIYPKTIWIFGQAEDGSWVATNAHDGENENVKVFDTEDGITKLIDWFTSKGWNIIPWDEVTNRYDRDGNTRFDEAVRSLQPILDHPFELVVLYNKDTDSYTRYFFSVFDGFMYGSRNPDFLIRNGNIDQRISKRLNNGYEIVVDNRSV